MFGNAQRGAHGSSELPRAAQGYSEVYSIIKVVGFASDTASIAPCLPFYLYKCSKLFVAAQRC